MLTAVTGPGGTGEAAAMEGYLVAGKTGTAQKADARGGYAENAWTSTFVGFVPAERPRLVISVVIDEPVIEHYGGAVAGPIFRRIAADSLRHLGVPPAADENKLREVVKELREQREQREQRSDARPVARKQAQAERSPVDGKVRVPNLHGFGAREALVALNQAGLSMTLAGSGATVEQSPPPGAIVNPGATVHLILKRPGAREAEQAASRSRSVREQERAGALAVAGRLTR
jgi:cell division protein FtsI (penicillin-binding protein 3)